MGRLLGCAALAALALAATPSVAAAANTSSGAPAPLEPPAARAVPNTPGAYTFPSLEDALARARALGRRPLVGVVLSGGGARGLAHIGALAALEEMGIPIDRVGGTSMGGVVGGLYASGYTAAQIEEITSDLDWPLLFSDIPARESLSPLQKERHRRTLLDLGFQGGRLTGAGGLVAGQRLTALFSTLTLHVADRERFETLPVPFVCVATDVATGAEEVLEGGSLHLAMRASSAIPLVFRPVERQGRRLIDGSLSNNLPVDRVRALGAEVIVALDVSEPLLPPEQLGSILGVAQQIVAYRSVENRDRQARESDLLIIPDLSAFGHSDFAASAGLIAAGRRSIRAAAGPLSRLAEACRLPSPPGAAAPSVPATGAATRPPPDPSDPATMEAIAASSPASRPPGEGPVIDRVVVEGTAGMRPQVYERWIRVPTGKPLDAQTLARQIEDIYATGYFELVQPSIEPLPEGGHLLRMRLEDKRGLQLGLGLRYEDERGPAMLLTLGRFNFWGGDNGAYIDARLGTVSSLEFRYLQPSYPATSFFASLRAGGSDDFRFVYGPGHDRDRYLDRRAFIDLAAGNTVRTLGEVSLAYRLEQINFRAEEEPQNGLVGKENSRLGMLSLRSRADSLDDANFPSRGRKLEFAADSARDSLGSEARFDRARLTYDAYRAIGPGTAHLGVRLGTAFGGELPESEKLLLGGPESLYGLRRAEGRGDELASLRLGWQVPLGDLPFLGGGRYFLGGMLDVGSVTAERRDLGDDPTFGFGIEISADSRVGPIRLAAGWAEEGAETIYFSAGFPF